MPCAVEIVKLVIAVAFCSFDDSWRNAVKSSKTVWGFFRYSIIAFCYFLSNNCMFYIIRHLGASTFQVMNNLKVISTAFFMHVFLGKKLTWKQWKVLIILAIGSMVTQLNAETKNVNDIDESSSPVIGYIIVV